jgi:hypothetical protein
MRPAIALACALLMGACTPQISDATSDATKQAAVSSTPSAGGTTVPPADSIVDGDGSVWTILDQQVAHDGIVDQDTSWVTLLLYEGGTLYQQNGWGDWYGWVGGQWEKESGDPRSAMPTSPTSPTSPAAAAGYHLVFSDDFTSLDLSPDRLGDHRWYDGYWWEHTVAPASNIFVSDLGLTLVWNDGQGVPDTDISSTAQDASFSRAFQFGYFEARLQWENQTMGAWPAFWLIPIEGIQGATDTGEIDIMEGQGGAFPNTYYGTIHEWLDNADVYNNDSSNAYDVPSGTDLSAFHTYGARWEPGKVTWYFDGQAVHSAATTPVMDSQHYFIVLGSQAGANWTAGAGVAAARLTMSVQWVRVWQQ